MKILTFIAPTNQLSETRLAGFDIEYITRVSQLALDDLKGPYDLLIIDLSQSLKDLIKVFRANPDLRMIVLGNDARLPPGLQNWAAYRAQALSWRIVNEDSSAIARLYRTMLARTPTPA